jgi:hypothetical protein
MFLAGPTPRGEGVSWRPEALRILDALGYDGHVFIPEPRDGKWGKDYVGQIDWEEQGLHQADAIIFWVPRVIGGPQPMPAFTTNDEWGTWKGSGKAFFGAPPEAEKVRYQQHYAKVLGVPLADSLEGTLQNAVSRLAEGALRAEGARMVPLHVWREKRFQDWLRLRQAHGQKLTDCRVMFWSPGLFVLALTMQLPETAPLAPNMANQTEIVVFRRAVATVTLET